MPIRAFAAIPFLSLVLSACTTQPVERYGAALNAAQRVVPVEELLAAPAQADGSTLVLEGTVRDVCPKKGCWMILGDGERELRVTFQDYGFFVPLDSTGASVRCEGVFAIAEVPADEARHYLEDAGKHDEAAAITAPVKSYTFVARGVELRR